MQSHPSDLSALSTLRPAPTPPPGTVRALGLSDALRVEFQPCQRSGLLDELDALREPLVEAFESARASWEAVSSPENGGSPRQARVAEEKFESKAYALRVHAAIRSQVPGAVNDEAFAIVGPASTISTLVEGAARHAADRLGEFLRAPRRDEKTRRRLREHGVAALAWIETYIDCQAIEFYSFDAAWDHVPSPGGA
jgi:hypothetical protein